MAYEVNVMTRLTIKLSSFPKTILIAGTVASLNAGCMTESAVEKDFGKSVKQMQYVQAYDKAAILSPQLGPIKGLDGGSGANALKEYRNSFTKPEEDSLKNEAIFTLGGSSGGGR
jgi:hypothetical protein